MKEGTESYELPPPAVDQNQICNTFNNKEFNKRKFRLKVYGLYLVSRDLFDQVLLFKDDQAGGDFWLLSIIWQWPLRETPRLVTSLLKSTAPLPPGLAFQ